MGEILGSRRDGMDVGTEVNKTQVDYEENEIMEREKELGSCGCY